MDNKRVYRQIKREIKKEGNRHRRNYFKQQLRENPIETHWDEYYFKWDTTKPLNGVDNKRERLTQMPLDPTILKMRKGDATNPIGEGVRIIAHVVNNQRRWGAGFTKSLSQRWIAPQIEFLKWSGHLGDIQLVQVTPTIYVANMMCQQGLRNQQNPVPLKYDHLRTCLQKLSIEAAQMNASIHMPKKIGSGLAGGDFSRVLAVIDEVFTDTNIEINLYDFD